MIKKNGFLQSHQYVSKYIFCLGIWILTISSITSLWSSITYQLTIIKYSSQNFFWKDSTNFRHRKMTLKLRILRSLTRLFIILVSLTRSLFSEKMLISNRYISGLMSNLIKKSWTVSTRQPSTVTAGGWKKRHAAHN